MKPTESEEEYFARMEFERKKKVEDKKHKKLTEQAKKDLKNSPFHAMSQMRHGADRNRLQGY